MQNSDVYAILAVIVSIISLLFSVVIYNRDRRKELEGFIYMEKLKRYQELLKIGRRLLFYELDNIENEVDSTKIYSSINHLLDLSDELMLLAPSNISAKAIHLAISIRKMNQAFIKKDRVKFDKLHKTNVDLQTSFLSDILGDLNVRNMNHSLKRRTKSGFSRKQAIAERTLFKAQVAAEGLDD